MVVENWSFFFETCKPTYIATHVYKHAHRQTGVTPLRDQWEHVPHTTAVVIRPHTHTQMCVMACGAQRELTALWRVSWLATRSASL